MFDSHLRRLIEPPLNAIGRGLASKDICADHVTLLGGDIHTCFGRSFGLWSRGLRGVFAVWAQPPL